MLNERDGGIGGVKLIVEECETGYDTKKGVECYDAVKGKNPAVVNPYSTGITLQLIPKAAVDKIPILSMAYGLSASADGNLFPWIFNPPATYWDGASAFIRHVADVEGGFDKLKGKKIGLVHLDAPYGKEPIPLLAAARQGLRLRAQALSGAGAADAEPIARSGSTSGATSRTGFIIQGWGAMNPTAVKEAAKIGFPMGRLVGVWWSGNDDDARPAGPEAKGYSSLDLNAVGTDFPVIQDILKYVVDKGKSQITSKDKVGENFYNRAIWNSVLIAEAIRNAQKITGKKVVNGEDVRRGFEALDITPARMKELGMEGFAAPVKLSCADHNGHGGISLVEWDGTKWNTKVPSDTADQGQGAAADQLDRRGICESQYRLAEADRAMRQVVVR